MSKSGDLQRRADMFADRSIEFVKGLPDSMISRRLGAQYLDAATSVAANYRAARRGRSHDEFTAKLGLVSEEADESVFWLERMASAGIVGSEPPASLLQEALELAKIFYASSRTARSRRRKRRDGDPVPR